MFLTNDVVLKKGEGNKAKIKNYGFLETHFKNNMTTTALVSKNIQKYKSKQTNLQPLLF